MQKATSNLEKNTLNQVIAHAMRFDTVPWWKNYR